MDILHRHDSDRQPMFHSQLLEFFHGAAKQASATYNITINAVDADAVKRQPVPVGDWLDVHPEVELLVVSVYGRVEGVVLLDDLHHGTGHSAGKLGSLLFRDGGGRLIVKPP